MISKDVYLYIYIYLVLKDQEKVKAELKKVTLGALKIRKNPKA